MGKGGARILTARGGEKPIGKTPRLGRPARRGELLLRMGEGTRGEGALLWEGGGSLS